MESRKKNYQKILQNSHMRQAFKFNRWKSQNKICHMLLAGKSNCETCQKQLKTWAKLQHIYWVTPNMQQMGLSPQRQFILRVEVKCWQANHFITAKTFAREKLLFWIKRECGRILLTKLVLNYQLKAKEVRYTTFSILNIYNFWRTMILPRSWN